VADARAASVARQRRAQRRSDAAALLGVVHHHRQLGSGCIREWVVRRDADQAAIYFGNEHVAGGDLVQDLVHGAHARGVKTLKQTLR
jgi:hypothetical protein